MNSKTVSLLCLGLLAVTGLAPAVSPVITVNSAADPATSGSDCTLRDAITAATTNAPSNGCPAGVAKPAVDTIAFNIPGIDCPSGICTIPLSTALPDISEPVLINGYTQSGASANTLATGDNAVIRIRIDASNITGTALHLAGGSDGSTVQGLSIVKPSGDTKNLGYLIAVSSGNNVVTGNFIGVEPDGTTVSTDNLTFAALEIGGSSSGNTVGGATPAGRNLIAATNAGSTHAFDLDPGSAINNVVQGNYFDLDASGSNGIGSAAIAVHVNAGGTTVGGSAAGAGNVIGAWGTAGLQVESSAFAPVATITAQGNLIGTDTTGTIALAGAGSYGIVVGDSNGTVTVGTAGAGNLVHGASIGIYVHGLASAGTPVIQGNHIGVDLGGTVPLPISGPGIYIDAGGDFGSQLSGGLVGGTNAGEGNVIAFGGTNAVAVVFNGVRWELLGNSMHGNGFGISLGGSGTPTPNDTNDADTGSNNLQNYPVLDPGVVGPKTTVQVSGSLNSEANTTYRLQFFANAGCDQSGHGQGKIYLDSADIMVTTNTNDVAFGPLVLTTPIDRHVITATATDPAGNTSEFSACSGDDTIFSESFEGN